MTITALVEAGCAYALLPRLAVESADLCLEVFGQHRREIHLVWHGDRELQDSARRFVEMAQEGFAGYQTQAEHALT